MPQAEQWNDIGELLELTEEDMKEVVSQEANLTSVKCLRKILKVWLDKGQPPPTWETIRGIKEVL